MDGATANEQFLFAARQDNPDLLREILEDEENDLSVNCTDSTGCTALHHAAGHLSVECVEMLASVSDIDVNIQDRLYRETPLHKALKAEDADADEFANVVRELLNAGAEIDIKDKNGRTVKAIVDENRRLPEEVRRLVHAAAYADAMDTKADDGNDSESEEEEEEED